MNYKEMYLTLMTTQLKAIEDLETTLANLKQAHQQTEELYLSAPVGEIVLMPKVKDTDAQWAPLPDRNYV